MLIATFVLALAACVAQLRRAEFQTARAETIQYEDDVSDLFKARGLPALRGSHNQDPLRDFRLEDRSGAWLAGRLPAPNRRFSPGERAWATYTPGGSVGPIMAYTRPEPDGSRLFVGEYLRIRQRQDDALFATVAAFIGLVASCGLGVGAFVANKVMRRIDAITDTIDRYAGGMRTLRLPAGAAERSDLDALAGALNDMMDRENRLVDGIRQVSSSVAHDLRTPLAWHNQEIARALAGPASLEAYRAALVQASQRVAEVLKTFQSLLHITELEAGAPGLGLEAVDLGAVAGEVVEAFTPMAEAGDRVLDYRPPARAVLIQADARVIASVVANLIENALRYTPGGTRIRVSVDPSGPRLEVADDGPGVPDGDLKRIFERFVRLDPSRSGPGNGLGLALVAAAVSAFGGRVAAENRNPGLCVSAIFDGSRARPPRVLAESAAPTSQSAA